MDRSEILAGRKLEENLSAKAQKLAHFGRATGPKVVAVLCAVAVCGVGVGRAAIRENSQAKQQMSAEVAAVVELPEVEVPLAAMTNEQQAEIPVLEDTQVLTAEIQPEEDADIPVVDMVTSDVEADTVVSTSMTDEAAMMSLYETPVDVPSMEPMVGDSAGITTPEAPTETPAPDIPNPDVPAETPEVTTPEENPDVSTPDTPTEENPPVVPENPDVDENNPGETDTDPANPGGEGGDDGEEPGLVDPGDKEEGEGETETEEGGSEEGEGETGTGEGGSEEGEGETETEEGGSEEGEGETGTEEGGSEEGEGETGTGEGESGGDGEKEPEEDREMVIIGYEVMTWYRIYTTDEKWHYLDKDTWEYAEENDIRWFKGMEIIIMETYSSVKPIWGYPEEAEE